MGTSQATTGAHSLECGPWKHVNSPCPLSSPKPRNCPFQGCHWGCRRPIPHSASRCFPLWPSCGLEGLLPLDKQPGSRPALLQAVAYPSLAVCIDEVGTLASPGCPKHQLLPCAPGISWPYRVGAQTSVHLSRACPAGPSAAACSSAQLPHGAGRQPPSVVCGRGNRPRAGHRARNHRCEGQSIP